MHLSFICLSPLATEEAQDKTVGYVLRYGRKKMGGHTLFHLQFVLSKAAS